MIKKIHYSTLLVSHVTQNEISSLSLQCNVTANSKGHMEFILRSFYPTLQSECIVLFPFCLNAFSSWYWFLLKYLNFFHCVFNRIGLSKPTNL